MTAEKPEGDVALDSPDAWLARTMPGDLYEWYTHLQLHVTEHDARHAGRAFREAWPQIRDWFVREVRVARSNRDSWKHWANVHRSQIREYEAETIAANTAKEAIRVELARAERNLEGANAANASLRAKLAERSRALLTYGQHQQHCFLMSGRSKPNDHCDCGFRQSAQAAEVGKT